MSEGLAGLSRQKDELIKQRGDLVARLEELKQKLSQLEQTPQDGASGEEPQPGASKELEPDTIERYLEYSRILDKYSTLPSNDWGQRLKLLREFTHMEIRNVQETAEQGFRQVQFDAVFPKWFEFSLQIVFAQDTEKMESFRVVRHGYPELQEFVRRCEETTNVSAFLFGAESYFLKCVLRFETWCGLMDRYSNMEINGGAAAIEGKLQRFISLKHRTTMRIRGPSGKYADLTWNLYFDETDPTSTCLSELGCFVTEPNGTVDLTQVLNDAVVTKGLLQAMSTVIDNLV